VFRVKAMTERVAYHLIVEHSDVPRVRQPQNPLRTARCLIDRPHIRR
jgi:hypothetical protein